MQPGGLISDALAARRGNGGGWTATLRASLLERLAPALPSPGQVTVIVANRGQRRDDITRALAAAAQTAGTPTCWVGVSASKQWGWFDRELARVAGSLGLAKPACEHYMPWEATAAQIVEDQHPEFGMIVIGALDVIEVDNRAHPALRVSALKQAAGELGVAVIAAYAAREEGNAFGADVEQKLLQAADCCFGVEPGGSVATLRRLTPGGRDVVL
jgi:hypothetical protein